MGFWKRLFRQEDRKNTHEEVSLKFGATALSASSAAANQDRVIRVFISSTFRDMHAERDYLVKFIFPQLRRLCESRGVTWGEVDLRWGVTTEQKAEGKVLPICLEEIHRCRPYFIGLLGERYGWVPDAIPAELIEREPWLREHLKHSVTELEILHGVLNNPEMAEHAFFYFRDPKYVERIPQEEKKDFSTEDAESVEKLRQLKERIRQSGFPVRENYPDPKVLGELALKDMTAVIDRLFPEGSQPDPLDRETMDHEAYAASRRHVYIGRREYFERLDDHAASDSTVPLVILGESGSGKSALLANWIAHYREKHPDTLVIQHYIGASPYSAEWAPMLRRIMGEFKRQLGIKDEIPAKPEDLRSAFPNWLYMAAAKGRVILILDALNQLEDREGALDLVWLPPVMPVDLRLIVSTLPGRPLNEIRRRRWSDMNVQPLDTAERHRLIVDYLAEQSRALDKARADRIAAAPQSANPLFLRILLEELRVFGLHEKLGEQIEYLLASPTIEDLCRKVIIRWEQDYGGGTPLVGDVLSMLWAARRGLGETELLEFLGTDKGPLPRANWSPLYLAMSGYLITRGGLLTFAHDYIRLAAREAYVPNESEQKAARLRLADYFERQPAGPRRIDELPWQLSEATSWQRLYKLLCDLPFFQAAWNANEFDLKAYWVRIESNSGFRMVDGYSKVLDAPGRHQEFVWSMATLLHDTGHPVEALSLREYLVELYRQTGDRTQLSSALGNQALILKDRGDLDGAMALYKDQERICRELGDKAGLSRTLGN